MVRVRWNSVEVNDVLIPRLKQEARIWH